MVEFLWFAAGAIAYQLLAKLIRVSQLYIFFQEVHVHTLLMLDAASQDLETAVQLKTELLEESSLEKEDIALILGSDEQAIDSWKAAAIANMQTFVPSLFKAFFANSVVRWYKQQIKDGTMKEPQIENCIFVLRKFLKGKLDLCWENGIIKVKQTSKGETNGSNSMENTDG